MAGAVSSQQTQDDTEDVTPATDLNFEGLGFASGNMWPNAGPNDLFGSMNMGVPMDMLGVQNPGFVFYS
jgi:hypothetical protein